jgi:hypothetical protein
MAMVMQLRTYTIHEGMMDSWLELFTTHIRPVVEAYGMPIEGMWVDDSRTEFIWLRSFVTVAEIAEKEEAFLNSKEMAPVRESGRAHISNVEVKLVEPVDGTT